MSDKLKPKPSTLARDMRALCKMRDVDRVRITTRGVDFTAAAFRSHSAAIEIAREHFRKAAAAGLVSARNPSMEVFSAQVREAELLPLGAATCRTPEGAMTKLRVAMKATGKGG